MTAGAWRRVCLTALLALLGTPSQANSLSFCGHPARISTEQADRLLRVGSLVEDLLAKSAANAVIVSRSGLDLRRFKLRYSHAGIALKPEEAKAWQIRQLYFDCQEERPRIFDQGIPGFVLSQDDENSVFVSLVFLPREEAVRLEERAADKRLALSLLGVQYSANAYPFATRYQNCNQWVMELLAHALGALSSQPDTTGARQQAQTWLAQAQYQPTEIAANGLMVFASRFVPFLHQDDHTDEELAQNINRISMPASVEAFIRAKLPAATRTELCLRGKQVVIHQGWQALQTCQAGEQDSIVELD